MPGITNQHRTLEPIALIKQTKFHNKNTNTLRSRSTSFANRNFGGNDTACCILEVSKPFDSLFYVNLMDVLRILHTSKKERERERERERRGDTERESYREKERE